MNEDVFVDIDALDAALDEEFGKVANEPNEDVTEEIDEEVEETSGEKDTQPVDGNDNVETTSEPITEKKPENDNKANKKDYAFANLRTENGNLKRERDAYKSDSDYLKALAQEYGYSDVSSFQQALKQSKYQREAQEKGYDYSLYKKTMEQEERIAQLEKQRVEQENEVKIERFKNALDSAVSKYEISEEEIFGRLEDAGITVEEILTISNPNLLIKGVLSDRIQEQAKQSHIEEIKNMKGLVEDDNEQNAQVTKVSIDDLLKSDLAKYKADNFL